MITIIYIQIKNAYMTSVIKETFRVPLHIFVFEFSVDIVEQISMSI